MKSTSDENMKITQYVRMNRGPSVIGGIVTIDENFEVGEESFIGISTLIIVMALRNDDHLTGDTHPLVLDK
jgi:hypothetical protein